MTENKIEAESKRRTLLAGELRWQKYNVDREGDSYTWLNALNDTMSRAEDNGEKNIKRQCVNLYFELGFMKEIDPSKITVFGRGGKTRGLHRRDGKYYELESPKNG